MSDQYRFTWHTDPSHGWLEMHTEILHKAGIADKVSMYSYMNGDITYLEEDCDAPLFLSVLDEHGLKYSFNEEHTNSEHWIRRLPAYKYRKPVEDVLTSIFTGVGQ